MLDAAHMHERMNARASARHRASGNRRPACHRHSHIDARREMRHLGHSGTGRKKGMPETRDGSKVRTGKQWPRRRETSSGALRHPHTFTTSAAAEEVVAAAGEAVAGEAEEEARTIPARDDGDGHLRDDGHQDHAYRIRRQGHAYRIRRRDHRGLRAVQPAACPRMRMRPRGRRGVSCCCSYHTFTFCFRVCVCVPRILPRTLG